MNNPTKFKRQHQILHAAAKCFAEKGYHTTTMDDIVREAGLSKGTLYWYFNSKKALFRSLIDYWLGELLVEASDWSEIVQVVDAVDVGERRGIMVNANPLKQQVLGYVAKDAR